jgi:hypothetical protein
MLDLLNGKTFNDEVFVKIPRGCTNDLVGDSIALSFIVIFRIEFLPLRFS